MWKASTLPSDAATEAEQPFACDGTWHPPGGSRAVPARLVADRGRVEIVPADVAAEVALATGLETEVEVSARVGSIPRRVVLPDGSVFVSHDNDALDRWLQRRHGAGYGFVAALERFHPRLLVVVAMIVALCFATYRYALPVMVEVAVAVTPPVAPQMMGRSVLATLDHSLLAPSALGEGVQDSLKRQFRDLADLSPRKAEGFTLHLRRGGRIGANAFALPDGAIILTDELVELAQSEDEILGVLAHEIGHVEHEHSLRRLYLAAGLSGLIMLAGGDIGAAVEDLLMQGSLLVTLSYSRDHEHEADRYSAALMARAGRDPLALGRLFARLEEELGAGGGGLLSTHPATGERIDRLRREAESQLRD
ncbi:Zn-dependent protease with chaperone function [Chelatococcus caeni]|uniref:Zn-dependent protease with chaperone function n=1 Tax=Chelatococcus caeni TaxID=1348468 RepID=A0A840BW07_9HYPH|nr:M48 family metallopeptidase [Chelatococcus caeni]MBB4015658.1 Zn-dependent protease with chaperone function [Chelatococcus caeni]